MPSARSNVDKGRLRPNLLLRGLLRMRAKPIVLLANLLLGPVLLAQQSANAPLPDIRQLLAEVREHQQQLDKVRENYTYSALHTMQTVDSSGKILETETQEDEDFFVNGHAIERVVKRNGNPLAGHDLDKETEHVTKLVEKAEKTPPDQPLDGPVVSITRVLEIMDVRNPRRVMYRGRPAIVFDFVGRKDAKTHGLAEDASKKLQGTIWIDEADRQVAHLEVSFIDNFRIAAGLFATIQKGSSFYFDQALVNEGLWLPTGGEANVQARVLVFKNMRMHILEKDYGYKRFNVETQQQKGATVVTPGK